MQILAKARPGSFPRRRDASKLIVRHGSFHLPSSRSRRPRAILPALFLYTFPGSLIIPCPSSAKRRSVMFHGRRRPNLSRWPLHLGSNVFITTRQSYDM